MSPDVRSNIRLLSLDRPGFGDSTVKVNRSLLDYGDDVLELLEHLNIDEDEKISIIGYSAGGPFALACASHAQLSQRLKCVVPVSSLGPREQPDSTDGMPFKLRLGFWLSKYSPGIVARVFAKDARQLIDKTLPDKQQHICNQWKDISPEDFDLVTNNHDIRDTFLTNTLHAYEKEQYYTEAWECYLFANTWGFHLEEISRDISVLVFYGLKDKQCVPPMGRYITRAIPNSTEFIAEEYGHLYFFTAWETILKEIVQRIE